MVNTVLVNYAINLKYQLKKGILIKEGHYSIQPNHQKS